MSFKTCPYVQRAVHRNAREGGAGHHHLHRPCPPAGMVPRDLAARQGTAAQGRRHGTVRIGGHRRVPR
ncbi:MAG: hypothetical protein MZV65_29775 [Chromatiales bacterium]|nr:hypothetical protein [Chromatiales bacterium]